MDTPFQTIYYKNQQFQSYNRAQNTKHDVQNAVYIVAHKFNFWWSREFYSQKYGCFAKFTKIKDIRPWFYDIKPRNSTLLKVKYEW